MKRKGDAQEFRLEINTIGAPILPNTELDIGNKKTDFNLMPGEYTASIHLEYGKGDVLDKEISFNISEDGRAELIMERKEK